MIYSNQGFLKRAGEAGRKISQNKNYKFSLEDIIVGDSCVSSTLIAACGSIRCVSTLSPTHLISTYTLELDSHELPNSDEFDFLCQQIGAYGFYLKAYLDQDTAYIQIEKHVDLELAQKDVYSTMLTLHGQLAYKILANRSLIQLAIQQSNPEIFMHLVFIEGFDTMPETTKTLEEYKPLEELLDELIGISLQDLSLSAYTQWLKDEINKANTDFIAVEQDISKGFMKLNIPIKPWIQVSQDRIDEVMANEYLVDFFPDNKTYSYLPWVISKEGEKLFPIHWDKSVVDLQNITSYNTLYCKPCFIDGTKDDACALVYLNLYTSVLREQDIHTTYLKEYEAFDTMKLLDLVDDDIDKAGIIFAWLIETEYYLGAFWSGDPKSRAYSPSSWSAHNKAASTILARSLGKSLRTLPAKLADLHLALAKALIYEYEIDAQEAFLMEASSKEIAIFLDPYFELNVFENVIRIQD